MSKRTKYILMAAGTALSSQIYLNMFADGFIIAFSPLMMAVFLYLFRDLNPFRSICLIALASPLFRLVVMIMQSGNVVDSMHLVLPDMAFFFAYAFFFCKLFYRFGYTPYHNYYLRIALCDFCSNCVELSVRALSSLATFSIATFQGFLILALVRSLLVLLVCIILDINYSLLTRQEHEANYKQLLLMAATLNSEVYFMQKNMNEIEDIMKNAFSLYRTLQEDNYPKELQNTSLTIAKDIHEVKKGYRRVIKGIHDNFLIGFKDSPTLLLSELLQILSADIDRASMTARLHLSIYTSYETDYRIQKHFAFTSIVRNLVNNSVDALTSLSPTHHGEIFVRCRDMVKNGRPYCVVEVKDNGPGIEENIKEVMFVPGFSTKYDEDTGDINRGLGLTLVKDLLEQKFDGSIEVTSSEKGAQFLLWFPVDKLTEAVDSYAELPPEQEEDLEKGTA
ncbi:MAG: ATP-binding protein [Lachnospiraceae bacterium]|nr:ATP-binding protein [Lachnospiraceae bacterium]